MNEEELDLLYAAFVAGARTMGPLLGYDDLESDSSLEEDLTEEFDRWLAERAVEEV